MKTIYIAGPIHSYSIFSTWHKVLEVSLQLKGYVVYNPFQQSLMEENQFLQNLLFDGRYEELSNTIKAIAYKNLQNLQKADIFILKYDPAISMMGGIDALIKALEWKKNIYVYCQPNHYDLIDPYIFNFINVIYIDWKKLLKTLDYDNN